VELPEEILGFAPEHDQVDYEPALYLRDVKGNLCLTLLLTGGLLLLDIEVETPSAEHSLKQLS
jgi:hypothetical protein